MDNQRRKPSCGAVIAMVVIVLALLFVILPSIADWLDADGLLQNICSGVIILLGLAFIAKS